MFISTTLYTSIVMSQASYVVLYFPLVVMVTVPGLDDNLSLANILAATLLTNGQINYKGGVLSYLFEN